MFVRIWRKAAENLWHLCVIVNPCFWFETHQPEKPKWRETAINRWDKFDWIFGLFEATLVVWPVWGGEEKILCESVCFSVTNELYKKPQRRTDFAVGSMAEHAKYAGQQPQGWPAAGLIAALDVLRSQLFKANIIGRFQVSFKTFFTFCQILTEYNYLLKLCDSVSINLRSNIFQSLDP